MRRALWIALMIAGVGTAWWYLARDGGSHTRRNDGGRAAPIDGTDIPSPSSTTLPASRAIAPKRFEAPSPANARVTVRVRTEDGRPVVGAATYWMWPTQRDRAVPAGEQWATNADGIAIAPWFDPPRYLAIYHPDYQPASIEAPEPDSDHDVTLKVGFSLEVTFLTRADAPVAGVELRCGRRPPGMISAVGVGGAPLLPAGDATRAERAARSDGTGRARITGLAPGAWYLSAEHPAFIALEEWRFRPLLIESDLQHETRMARLFAAVANLQPDSAGVIAVFTTQIRGETALDRIAGSGTAAIDGASRRLRERFGAQVCAVMVLPGDIEPEPKHWPRQSVQVDFAEFARTALQVPIHPIDEIVAPDSVAIASSDLHPIPSGEIMVTVEDANGDPVPIARVVARGLEVDEWHYTEFATGKAVRLPAGRYRIEATYDTEFRSFLAEVPAEVTAGSCTKTVMKSRVRMAPVRILPVDARSASDAEARLQFERGREGYEVNAKLPHLTWLPVGDWDVFGSMGEFTVSRTKVHVESRPAGAAPLELALPLEAK